MITISPGTQQWDWRRAANILPTNAASKVETVAACCSIEGHVALIHRLPLWVSLSIGVDWRRAARSLAEGLKKAKPNFFAQPAGTIMYLGSNM
jgi:hypothetical protein